MSDIPKWAMARAKMVISGADPEEAIARYIASQEAPDASTEVRCAREACAEAFAGNGANRAASNYRKGLYDNISDWEMWIAVRAIELWKSHEAASQ